MSNIFSKLFLIVLLPLALTSPHVTPLISTLLRFGRALSSFITGILQKHGKNYAAAISHSARQIYSPARGRAKFLNLLGKSPWGRKRSSILPGLPTRVPRNVQIILNNTLEGTLGLLPNNTQILLHKFFANRAGIFFLYLFIFRYLRLLVHLISFTFFYRPTPIPQTPTIKPKDVTVILPILSPSTPHFGDCLTSCLMNEPAVVIIVPTGAEMAARTKEIVVPYQRRFPYTKISVKALDVPHKKIQIAHALQYVDTEITVMLEDNIFWPSSRVLPTLLAPFEDPRVEGVTASVRVRRTATGINMRSFSEMLEALLVEELSFDARAIDAIDGNGSVIPGTSAYRSTILTDSKFVRRYTDERFLFNMFGSPGDNDSHKFIARWVMKAGYKTKIQHSRDACVERILSTCPGIIDRCLRSERAAWRSTFASSLSSPLVWARPWSLYAIHLSSLVDFALFYDAVLIITLVNSEVNKWQPDALKYLMRWIFMFKIVKVLPFFLRQPQDLLMLPGYFIFGYLQSFIRLYALLTFWKTDSCDGTIPVNESTASRKRALLHPIQTQIPPTSNPEGGSRTRSLQQPTQNHLNSAPDGRYTSDGVYAQRPKETADVRERRAAHAAPVTPPTARKRGRGRPKGSPAPSHRYEYDPAYTPRSSPGAGRDRVKDGGVEVSGSESVVMRKRGRPRKVV